jgi:hypothetical protein
VSRAQLTANEKLLLTFRALYHLLQLVALSGQDFPLFKQSPTEYHYRILRF